ncbi:MAG TPA: histidine kinase [Polyangiaceae bacterium]|nr:histidine kinase [Polyangiaceae bacterium]
MSRPKVVSLRRALGLWVLWSLPGVLLALQVGLLSPDGMGLLPAQLVQQVPPWWAWAVATPFVLRAGQRDAAAPPGAWARALPGHLGRASLVIAAHAAVFVLCARLVDAPFARGASFRSLVPFFFVKMAVFGAFAYAVTLAFARGFVEQRRRAELEASLARAQLDALRAQVQPHFLFNALNSVAMLVRKRDNEGALRVVCLLSDLLRAALRKGALPEVSLAEELAFVRTYLEVEEVRFRDRLRVRFDVEPGVEAAKVPAFLLQPLVENALRHGLAPRPEGGSVEVRAFRREGRLCVEVLDDGVGLGPGEGGGLGPGGGVGLGPGGGGGLGPGGGGDGRLGRGGGGGAGVGLSNLRARLEHAYAGAQRLELGPGPGGGARARVELPFAPAAPDA